MKIHRFYPLSVMNIKDQTETLRSYIVTIALTSITLHDLG